MTTGPLMTECDSCVLFDGIDHPIWNVLRVCSALMLCHGPNESLTKTSLFPHFLVQAVAIITTCVCIVHLTSQRQTTTANAALISHCLFRYVPGGLFGNDPQGWGPLNEDNNDLTPCAQGLLIFGPVNLIFIIMGSISIISVWYKLLESRSSPFCLEGSADAMQEVAQSLKFFT